MEDLLKKELGLSRIEKYGTGGGGWINHGQSFDTDQGKIYVKYNKPKFSELAHLMFEGETASLKALAATNIIRVPKPIKVMDNADGGSMFATEYLEMRDLKEYAAQLGEQIARLHLNNDEMAKKAEKQASSIHRDDQLEYTTKFGFHTTTSCGYLPQDNTWQEDWSIFYIRQRLQPQIDIVATQYGDSEAATLWAKLISKIPNFFKEVIIRPSLLHGDLWSGNAAELSDRPIVFDPACFYGHSEHDLAIAIMFGEGYPQVFYDTYFNIVPKAPGFTTRVKIYELFHYLNHWNHFGTSGYRYRDCSIRLMKELLASDVL